MFIIYDINFKKRDYVYGRQSEAFWICAKVAEHSQSCLLGIATSHEINAILLYCQLINLEALHDQARKRKQKKLISIY